MIKQLEEIKSIVDSSTKILIIQADNPDADSLATSLALEQILGDLGKEPFMYCSVDMPEYLKYLEGWDRVQNTLPKKFDSTIIVDTSAVTLLEKLEQSGKRPIVASKPVIVIDHHADVECDIDYASVVLNDKTRVSTGEVVFHISKELGWEISLKSAEFITSSILADSLGLISENTTPDTYRTVAELMELGVSRPKLEEIRRAYTKMPEKIFRYKAELIKRTEILLDGKMALIVIPQQEITEFSPLYNPNPLIQYEHLQTRGVLISVSIKSYDNGRITSAIRCNQSAPIASTLAEKFNGGGHDHSAGFKLESYDVNKLKTELISYVEELTHE